MANIPTIPGTAVTQDVAIGQKLDPSTGLALQGQVAKTFETAANVIGQYEERKQKAEENYVQNASTLSFHKMTQDFRDQVNKGMPDEQIVNNWDSQFNNWKQQQVEQYDSKLSPQARRQMQFAWDQGGISTRGEFQLVAEHKAVQRRRGAVHALGQEFINTGDEQTAKLYSTAIDNSITNGDMSYEEGDAKKAMILPRLQIAQVQHGINAGGQSTIDTVQKLQDGGFDAIINQDERRKLLSFGRTRIKTNQSSEADKFSEQIDNSPTQTIDPDLLKKARANQQISEQAYRSLLSRNKRISGTQDKNNSGLLASDIIDTDFVKSDNRDELYANFKDRIKSVQSVQLRNELSDRLNRKYGAAVKEMKSDFKPEIQTQLSIMQQDFNEGMAFVPLTSGKPATSGFFTGQEAEDPMHIKGGIRAIDKLDDDTFHEYFGKDAKREDVIESARLNYAKKQQEFLTKANSASPEQLKNPEFLDNLRKQIEFPDAKTAVKNTLFKGTKNLPPEQIKGAQDYINKNLDNPDPTVQKKVKAIIKVMMQP